MKTSRFSESLVVAILGEAANGSCGLVLTGADVVSSCLVLSPIVYICVIGRCFAV